MGRLTEKSPGCFEYSLKDHKSVPGEFGTYDAFFDYSMAVKKLGAYEDMEEQGRLVVLPCNVGDTVWCVWSDRILEAKVCCIRPFVSIDRIEFRGNAIWEHEDPFYHDGRFLSQEIFIVFGIDAFLNLEDAEAALKGGNKCQGG